MCPRSLPRERKNSNLKRGNRRPLEESHEREQCPWIDTVSPSAANLPLSAVYQTISPQGNVAHILQVQSLDPDALALHYALYRRLMFGESPLSRAEREMIAVAASKANRCEY